MIGNYKSLTNLRGISGMENRFKINSYFLASILCVMLITLSTVTSFAGEGEKIAWSTILPEEGNLTLQQQRVVNSFEITLNELDSVIDEKIKEGKISDNTDFTSNKDVSVVYDFLMYRIYELMKVDRKIKEDLVAQERSFYDDNVSSDVVRQYYTVRTDYERKGASFFSSLDSLKRAIFIKDLWAEIKNLKGSVGELEAMMNLYSSYRIASASR